MGRVWVVGSLNVDRPWRVAAHPVVGETVTGEALAPLPGGKGLNLAVAARRVGGDVALVGCVGDDADGRWLTSVASDEGIDVAGLGVVAGHRTGTALIVVDDRGANTVVVSAGANESLGPPTLDVGSGDVVVASLEVPAEAIASAFAHARDTGARTILNPSPVDRVAGLATKADVVVVNEHEAAVLVGHGAEPAVDHRGAIRQARALAGPGQTVVVTLGAGGAVAVEPDGEHTVIGCQVTAVDTTGAGDCFGGVLAAGLSAGLDLAAAMDRANEAAALAVTRFGTVAAMPTARELS